MLATRPCDPESSRWPFSKVDSASRKHLESRMSSAYESNLPTQQDWQGQYSYLPPDEGAVLGPSFDQSHDPTASSRSPRTVEAVPASIDAALKGSSRSPGIDSGAGDGKYGAEGRTITKENPQRSAENLYTVKRLEQCNDESAASADTPALSMGSTHFSSVSSTGQNPDPQMGTGVIDGKVEGMKEEEDEEEMVEDDDMIDIDGDQPPRPMTAAERTAARRKMKRFRLTHQQTRFLMSEFAKQPHPDAAHRERLSKEIPGLSPRQVQVWFQNRRAKIKRLTADDRNQMIKMRAVPDDFDNVQALHSPYGAVHGLGPPPAGPPVDFGNANYGGEPIMRPLTVDVRRHDADEHFSPTGLTPGFGGIGMGHGNGMGSSELMSPMTPNPDSRYQFGGQMSTPLSAGGRLSNSSAGRQSGFEATLHMSRQNMRPLQPLHLRDPLTRSRSESMHSPLRTSMSWKGDSMGYSTYPTPTSASDIAGRQHSAYDPNQMNPASHHGQGGFDSALTYGSQSSSYEQQGSAGLHSTQHMGYAVPQPPSSSRTSRLRAASASLPLNLDIKDQHRSPDLTPQSASGVQRPRAPSTTSQLDNPSIYTTSYPPAPLTAPLEFSLSKSGSSRSDAQNFSAPQMSAPIHAPSDFSNAFHAGMSGPTSRTPMRESFGGGGPLHYGQEPDPSDTFDNGSRGLYRKRSFTVPGGSGSALNTTEPQP